MGLELLLHKVKYSGSFQVMNTLYLIFSQEIYSFCNEKTYFKNLRHSIYTKSVVGVTALHGKPLSVQKIFPKVQSDEQLYGQ